MSRDQDQISKIMTISRKSRPVDTLLPALWKARLLQTLIEEFSWCVRKFRLCSLELTKEFRTRCLWQIKVPYDFFNILGVTEIWCSFRLVLEGKTGKDTWVIKIVAPRKVLSKQFCFIRCRRQHLWAIQ